MKGKGLEFLVATLLMGVGALFGSLAPRVNFFEFKFTDVFGVFSALAAIAGVIIAYDAVGSWKKQIHYSKKYTHAEELESVEACFDKLQAIGNACRGLGLAYFRGNGLHDAEKELERSRIEYFVQHSNYQAVWWRASRYIDNSELAEYRWTPYEIEGLYLGSLTKFYLEMTTLDLSDKLAAYTLIENSHQKIRSAVSDANNEARGDIDSMFKKLLM